MSPIIAGVVVLAALFLSGLTGTMEAALSSVSRARVEAMVKEETHASAKTLMRVAERKADHINLLVLVRTVLDATAAVFAAVAAMNYISNDLWALVAAIAGTALISFAIIGVFARTAGKKNPYSISLATAPFMFATVKILGPFAKLLIWIGNVVAPGPGFRDGPYNTEVELLEMVDIAQEHGVVEVEERRMIQSVFDLASSTARSVMVPRTEMVWIESGKSAGQATSLCVRSGLSRIPVIGESVDDVIGIVYLKDLVQRTYYSTDGGRSVTVDEVMRPVAFVPDSKNLDALLNEMQTERNHMAILVDEFGGVAGLLTIEDIIEEVVGEIADEYDDREVAPIEQFEDDHRSYRVLARLTLEDLADQIKEDHDVELEFSEEILDQVETVGGLLAYEVGRVPLPGTEVSSSGLRLRAEGGQDRRGRIRVTSVVVRLQEPDYMFDQEDPRDAE